MLYRENGQFKTTYTSDSQVFPIAQDRIAIWLILAFAALVVPLVVDEYMFRAILIPFLILSLAALGLNILVGYCGQISLGTGAFMAVGAYAAYNFSVRIDGMPLLLSRACTCRWPRWRRSFSATGLFCASNGSPTTHPQAR
jgi:branched-chain amino acid transport system permease protein